MRTILLLVAVLTMMSSKTYGQSVIYGFPQTEKQIAKADILLINIPSHQDGRFRDSQQMLNIIDLVNKNPTLQFRIEINIFLESRDFDLAYSKSLAQSLTKYLDKKATQKNYEIAGLGRDNPIFLNEQHPLYQKMNMRIQIFAD